MSNGGFIGGTDLLVQIRKSGNKPSAVFSIEQLEEFQGVSENETELFIGAGVTHQQLCELPIVKERFQVLHDALGVLGSPPIRHSGTIGGNLAWGSVSPAVMILPAVENFLKGKVLSDQILSQAGEMAMVGATPIDDIRASAEYRRRLTANLLFRLASDH